MAFHAIRGDRNAAAAYANITVRPLTGALGAEIDGVDVRDVDEATMTEIRRASAEHLVVFFRDQTLEVADLEAFTLRWGDFGDDPFVEAMPGHPNVVRVAKEADEKHPLVFGAAWHSDWSFQQPSPAQTLLYAVDVPDHGGDTLYASTQIAWEQLSTGLQAALEPLYGLHSPAGAYGSAATHNELMENVRIRYDERAHITVAQPIVRTHPVTGRKGLFVNPGYTIGIEGWRPDEAAPLLDHLYGVITDPTHTCRFRWAKGSLAVWDNRATLHLPISDYHGARREMWRTTVAGTTAPTT